jgi:hypothetical protein
LPYVDDPGYELVVVPYDGDRPVAIQSIPELGRPSGRWQAGARSCATSLATSNSTPGSLALTWESGFYARHTIDRADGRRAAGATTTLSFEVFRGTVQAVNIGPTAVYSIVILIANIVLGVVYTRLTGRVSA